MPHGARRVGRLKLRPAAPRQEAVPIFKHLSDFGGEEGLFVAHAHNLLGKDGEPAQSSAVPA